MPIHIPLKHRCPNYCYVLTHIHLWGYLRSNNSTWTIFKQLTIKYLVLNTTYRSRVIFVLLIHAPRKIRCLGKKGVDENYMLNIMIIHTLRSNVVEYFIHVGIFTCHIICMQLKLIMKRDVIQIYDYFLPFLLQGSPIKNFMYRASIWP
jgi:hypothetical protein